MCLHCSNWACPIDMHLMLKGMPAALKPSSRSARRITATSSACLQPCQQRHRRLMPHGRWDNASIQDMGPRLWYRVSRLLRHLPSLGRGLVHDGIDSRSCSFCLCPLVTLVLCWTGDLVREPVFALATALEIAGVNSQMGWVPLHTSCPKTCYRFSERSRRFVMSLLCPYQVRQVRPSSCLVMTEQARIKMAHQQRSDH